MILPKHQVELLILELTRLVVVELIKALPGHLVVDLAEAERTNRMRKFALVDLTRPILIPLFEEIDDTRRRADEGILQRPEEVLGHVDLPGAVAVQLVEALPQVRLRVLTLLALPHELAELRKVEPSVLIGVGCVPPPRQPTQERSFSLHWEGVLKFSPRTHLNPIPTANNPLLISTMCYVTSIPLYEA